MKKQETLKEMVRRVIKEESGIGTSEIADTNLNGIKNVLNRNTFKTVYFNAKKITPDEFEKIFSDAYDKLGYRHPAKYRIDGINLIVGWK